MGSRLTHRQREQRSIRRKAYLTLAGLAIAGLVIANAVGRSSTAQMPAETTPVASADDHPPAPDENTFDGKLAADHNREIYGHAWTQTNKEKAADAKWQDVQDAKSQLPGEGGDYKAYNATLTAAYHGWEIAERGAYGSDWQTLWRARNTGDILGECGSFQGLGMTHSECVSMEQAKGDIEPLEPMLMKCRPGGTIMPRDAVSCRTHGRQSEYSVRRAAQAAREPVSDVSSN